jgi:hypothetical protein
MNATLLQKAEDTSSLVNTETSSVNPTAEQVGRGNQLESLDPIGKQAPSRYT